MGIGKVRALSGEDTSHYTMAESRTDVYIALVASSLTLFNGINNIFCLTTILLPWVKK